jgi:hypothetical protein
MSHDVKFIIGDLNFRIDYSYEYAKLLAERFGNNEKMALKERD